MLGSLRAKQSALPLCNALGLPLEQDERLIEGRLGDATDGDWRNAISQMFEQPDLALANGQDAKSIATVGRGAIDDILADGRLPAVVLGHGLKLAMLAKTFDAMVNYDFWKSLSYPDVFIIESIRNEFRVQKIWDKHSRFGGFRQGSRENRDIISP